MKLTPARREHVAAAYAVGTLRGPARDWVERRLRRDAALCAEIVAWNERLSRWIERLAPVAPRAEVWSALERRIVAPLGVAMPAAVIDADAPTVIAPAPRAAPESTGFARWRADPINFWRGAAGLAFAATVALAIGIGLLLQPVPGPTHTAVFADAQGRPVWIVDARLPEGLLAIRALPSAAPPPGRAYELWMLPAGGAPVSLGLLPAQGETVFRLPEGLPARLLTAAGVAVSLEPAGGSPTGQPTGPVVYQAVLARTAG